MDILLWDETAGAFCSSGILWRQCGTVERWKRGKGEEGKRGRGGKGKRGRGEEGKRGRGEEVLNG
ncbi:MAG: hypothetical protein K0B08_05925 [Bacteroidales bacterium]|nr:hypothetical protein [Bacteroidales bacterium]